MENSVIFYKNPIFVNGHNFLSKTLHMFSKEKCLLSIVTDRSEQTLVEKQSDQGQHC